MPVTVRIKSNDQPTDAMSFGDDAEKIVLGRDPTACDVVFPAALVKVGREHCALHRDLGHYRLVLNRDHLVLVNGAQALDGQELPPHCELQLGPDGPVAVIESALSGEFLPTEAQGHRPGQATVLKDAKNTARRGLSVGLTALSFLVLLGSIGFIAQRRDENRHKAAQNQISAFDGKLTKLDTLTDEQSSFVREMNVKLQNLPPRMTEMLNNMAESVCLVLIQDADGYERVATAWVVDQDKGILATNAHVAEEFAKVGAGEKMIARSSAPVARDFVVTSVKIHPGYAAFAHLWDTYNPTLLSDVPEEENGPKVASARSITAAALAGDVALLFTQGSGLPPALPLAPAEVLNSLRPGDPVGYVGFPLEGLSLDGVNIQSPVPTTHVAHLTGITDFFGAIPIDNSQRLLVHHGLPTVGGASGSPIVNEHGQVIAVHCAGNVIGSLQSARIVSGVQVGYAQRIDFVRELLQNSAGDLQRARTELWEKEISKYFQPREKADQTIAIRGVAQDAVTAWRRDLTNRTHSEVTVENVAKFKKEPVSGEGPGDHYEAAFTAKVTAAGPCLIFLTAPDDPDISFVVYHDADAVTLRHRGEPTAGGAGHLFNAASFNVGGETTLRIVVKGSHPDRPFEIEVFHANIAPLSVDERRDRIVADWISGLNDKDGTDLESTLLTEASDKLPADDKENSVKATAVSLPADGHYLFVVNGEVSQDFDLIIARKADDKLEPLAVDNGLSAWAFSSIEVTDKQTVTVFVVGPKTGGDFRLWAYQAAAPRPEGK